MTRWKPARWTPVQMGLPRFLQNVSDETLLLTALGFGGGLVGGFKWIGKGMAQHFHVSPAWGAIMMGSAVASIPLFFGKEHRTSQFALYAYGIGAGLLTSGIIQTMFPKTSPAV